jgi:hypothetical protein
MATKNVLNKTALTKNRVEIIKELANPDQVADYLFSKEVLNSEMRDKVLVSIMKMFFLGVIKDTAL